MIYTLMNPISVWALAKWKVLVFPGKIQIIHPP
jgi:hypothetical protein